jgi:hypothetical protein
VLLTPDHCETDALTLQCRGRRTREGSHSNVLNGAWPDWLVSKTRVQRSRYKSTYSYERSSKQVCSTIPTQVPKYLRRSHHIPQSAIFPFLHAPSNPPPSNPPPWTNDNYLTCFTLFPCPSSSPINDTYLTWLTLFPLFFFFFFFLLKLSLSTTVA